MFRHFAKLFSPSPDDQYCEEDAGEDDEDEEEQEGGEKGGALRQSHRVDSLLGKKVDRRDSMNALCCKGVVSIRRRVNSLSCESIQ